MGKQPISSQFTTSQPSSAKKPLTCLRCRLKKRKCDGLQPCSHCRKALQRTPSSSASSPSEVIECVYDLVPKKRGRKKGYREVMKTKIEVLEGILGTLKEQGVVPESVGQLLKNLEGTSDSLVGVVGRADAARKLNGGGRTAKKFKSGEESSVGGGGRLMGREFESDDSDESDEFDFNNLTQEPAPVPPPLLKPAELLSPALSDSILSFASTRGGLSSNSFTSFLNETNGNGSVEQMSSPQALEALFWELRPRSDDREEDGELEPVEVVYAKPGIEPPISSLKNVGSRSLLTRRKQEQLDSVLQDWSFAESFFTAPSMSFASNLTNVWLSQDLLNTAIDGGMGQAFAASHGFASTGMPTITLLDDNPPSNLFNSGSPSIVPSHPTPPPKTPTQTLPDLETHLLSLYFNFINSYLPLLSETDFLSHYNQKTSKPHPPALLNAMLGLATTYSQHPLLFKKFKSPRLAGEWYIHKAQECIPTTTDCLAAVQAMLLIGIWGFGSNFGLQSYRWIGQACREACKIFLYSSEQNYTTYRFSIWRGPAESWTPEELELRSRTWANVFALDAVTSLVSGLPHALDANEFAGDLVAKGSMFQKLKEAGGFFMGDLKLSKEEMEDVERYAELENSWVDELGGLPKLSIFDSCGGRGVKSGSEHIRSRWKAEQIAATRALALPRGVSPFIRVFYSSVWPYYQLVYLLRKITRRATMSPEDFFRETYPANTLSDAAILNQLSPNPNILDLHNALMDWYNDLLPDHKPWKSLDEFKDPNNLPQPLPASQDQPLWIRLPLTSQMLFLYTAALSILHEPWGSSLKPLFKVSGEDGARWVSSLEMGALVHRALIYLTKTAYAESGFSEVPSMSEATEWVAPIMGSGESGVNVGIYDDEHPPPPLRLIESPLPAFCLYISTFNVLSALVPGANPLRKRYLFGDNHEPMDCITSIEEVVMPSFLLCGRVWKLTEIFLLRAKELLVEAKMQHIKPRMSKYDVRKSTFVETEMPEVNFGDGAGQRMLPTADELSYIPVLSTDTSSEPALTESSTDNPADVLPTIASKLPVLNDHISSFVKQSNSTKSSISPVSACSSSESSRSSVPTEAKEFDSLSQILADLDKFEG
ncbi:hypothetical protein HDV05_005307 [Chytridiales sp. JEL 0842]|nr:hypothetical protein HDV05_005307 [Chytridiales sp. JEL 0842]